MQQHCMDGRWPKYLPDPPLRPEVALSSQFDECVPLAWGGLLLLAEGFPVP